MIRRFAVDCFLHLSSGCVWLSEFFKNCGLELWRNRRERRR